ncbi:MAG: 4Fe-4S binding protein [Caldilineaceae bacterium]|nr:4Fe-4S binding protein [Caldilineaceae bacterium]
MNRLPLPVIDSVACTGCGTCIELCATDALALRHGKAMLAAPEACTYCTVCEDRCPESAIALPFLIVLGKRRE